MTEKMGLNMPYRELYDKILGICGRLNTGPEQDVTDICNLFPSFEPRQDVPSVDDILREMRNGETSDLFPTLKNDEIHARVAHGMMLALQKSERPRTMLDELVGMSSEEIQKVLQTSPEWRDLSLDTSKSIANFFHRLANTPAEPKPDPDAEAKKLAWLFYTHGTIRSGRLESIESYWASLPSGDQKSWRIVAATKVRGDANPNA